MPAGQVLGSLAIGERTDQTGSALILRGRLARLLAESPVHPLPLYLAVQSRHAVEGV